MDEERVQRRLAAIVVADVVGYSALIRFDEEGTRAAVRQHITETIEPRVANHRGRIFKTMGDGLLVEFASVVDAVRCAIEIQNAIKDHNTDVAKDKRVEFRIGVTLGDVIAEGDDLHGDGVNVAARLEGLAEPQGICISGSAFEQVRDKLEVGFENLGDQQVKNIDRPVRAYRVLTDPAAAGKFVTVPTKRTTYWKLPAIAAALVVFIAAGGLAWWQPWEPPAEQSSAEPKPFPLPDKPSIAVLPFQNLSDDPKQDYFADGMAEDIITGLSKLSALFVVDRNSSFRYREYGLDVKRIGRELGVAFILEGSVRRVGDRVRINVQLIDARMGGHLWAERYDGNLIDVFALQDKVTGRIIDALSLTLPDEDRDKLIDRDTEIIEAHDAFLRGRWYARQSTFKRSSGDYYSAAQDLELALGSYNRAIGLDPNYSRAEVAKSEVLSRTKVAMRELMDNIKPAGNVASLPNQRIKAGEEDRNKIIKAIDSATLKPGQMVSWSSSASGNNGTVVVTDSFRNSRGYDCRNYRRTTISGEVEMVHAGTACTDGLIGWFVEDETQVSMQTMAK